MKLAVYFLSCCIAASFQHPYQVHYNNQYQPLVSYYSNNGFYPSYPINHHDENYGDMALLRQMLLKQLKAKQKQNQASTNAHDDDNIKVEEEAPVNDVMARVNSRKKPNIEEDKIITEGRSFFLPKILLRNQVLATSTAYTIITSSITITTVAQCIKSSSFYGGSTQACRKRRGLLEAANQSNLNPTPVESIEITSGVGSSFPERLAEVDSSLLNPSRQAKAENYYGGLFGRTTTSTLTSFSLFTTLSINTVALGSSLSCLPNGYLVC